MEIDLTKLTIIELKALAFDLLMEQERNNRNLRSVQAELSKRVNIPQNPPNIPTN